MFTFDIHGFGERKTVKMHIIIKQRINYKIKTIKFKKNSTNVEQQICYEGQ